MVRAEIHRGALAEKIAKDDEPRCESVCKTFDGPSLPSEFWRCAYKAGHDGLHFRDGVIWGDS